MYDNALEVEEMLTPIMQHLVVDEGFGFFTP
jgi:hypothetical protein